MKSDDIAKIAGVSRSTVSKVINNYSVVNEETKRRVLEAIKEHNYAPNFSASVLAGKKTNTIGLFIKEDTHRPKGKLIIDNAYYTFVLTAAIDSLNDADYAVTVYKINSDEGVKKIEFIFCEKRIDAGILIGFDDMMIKEMLASPYPVVIMNCDLHLARSLENIRKNIALITTDAYLGIEAVMKYLISNGKRKIAFIKGTPGVNTHRMRYKAWEDAMNGAGIEKDPDFIIECDLSAAIAAQKVEELIVRNKLPEVFVCTNDEIAISVIKKLLQHNIKVPEEVGVTGFDDIMEARYITPALTTVKLPTREMAVQASKRAIELSESNGMEHVIDTFSTEFIERESAKN